MKTCFKCGESKPLTDFYRHPETKDGYLNKCKECTKRDTQENYQTDRQKHVEYERMRAQRATRKQKQIEYQRNARSNHPDVAHAHIFTSNAIRDGRLIRQPCEICGNEKSEAHHVDYTQPLNVRWLCFKHHREAHGQTVIETS